ncbi:hypothetical protein [Blastococcus sp. TF02A-26]|uniref:hypothetical protein n=1 Tax=Blastococcus sp. TF02A-26 TaxID=2250577 RepID=UPI000DEBE860|nr:hypothetical protein DQ240_22700 [Blastococcus sp. TF02A-26]
MAPEMHGHVRPGGPGCCTPRRRRRCQSCSAVGALPRAGRRSGKRRRGASDDLLGSARTPPDRRRRFGAEALRRRWGWLLYGWGSGGSRTDGASSGARLEPTAVHVRRSPPSSKRFAVHPTTAHRGSRLCGWAMAGCLTGAGMTAAAIEAMSRFAVAPKRLLHLPPTMSPSRTTTRPGLLEHVELTRFRGYRVAAA